MMLSKARVCERYVFIPAGLCSWVVNIIGFYNVYCDVEPKRRALEAANADLATAEDKLAKIKSKIKVRRLCTEVFRSVITKRIQVPFEKINTMTFL